MNIRDKIFFLFLLNFLLFFNLKKIKKCFKKITLLSNCKILHVLVKIFYSDFPIQIKCKLNFLHLIF